MIRVNLAPAAIRHALTHDDPELARASWEMDQAAIEYGVARYCRVSGPAVNYTKLAQNLKDCAVRLARILIEREAGEQQAISNNTGLVPDDIIVGMAVLYSPSPGGREYRGRVAHEPWELCGTMVTVLDDMEEAYGVDTGRPGRRRVNAAALFALRKDEQ